MDKQEKPIDYSRPVAYDTNGQPLYAHPPVPDKGSQSVAVDDAAMIKHIKSQKVFPELRLNDGDYVISSVRRHPIGLALPFSAGVLAIALAFIALFNYDIILGILRSSGMSVDASVVFWPSIGFILFILISEYMVYYVYSNNKFFLTNDSVIQQIQKGVFSNSEQIISLGNIEDASYSQTGIMQQMFNYGSIRLSTEGEETTYRLTYVANPKECIATLDNAVEDYKNCRRPC